MDFYNFKSDFSAINFFRSNLISHLNLMMLCDIILIEKTQTNFSVFFKAHVVVCSALSPFLYRRISITAYSFALRAKWVNFDAAKLFNYEKVWTQTINDGKELLWRWMMRGCEKVLYFPVFSFFFLTVQSLTLSRCILHSLHYYFMLD